jgi:hypothetical protein
VADLHDSAEWRKSRRCDSGACVEVATLDDAVALRDSKTVDGPILIFSHDSWATFLSGVRVGDFEAK